MRGEVTRAAATIYLEASPSAHSARCEGALGQDAHDQYQRRAPCSMRPGLAVSGESMRSSDAKHETTPCPCHAAAAHSPPACSVSSGSRVSQA